MESLAPPLSALLHVRWEIENGTSAREAIRSFLRIAQENDFTLVLREWVARRSHGHQTQDLIIALRSPYRRALLELFDRGWSGEPILDSLQEIEIELHGACLGELEEFVATLPFRAMIPLLGLQLPAYLLLLLGPVVLELLHSLGGP